MGDQVGTAWPRPLIAGSGPEGLTPAGEVPGKIRVQAVLVLYRRTLQESRTWQLLREQVETLNPEIRFNLLVCDNGPASGHIALFPEWVEYALAAENRGLAWAYQAGLTRAQEANADWLLTLDQDTSLPPDFLHRMLDRAARLANEAEVGALVPQLVSEDGNAHSPVIARLGREEMVAKGFTGFGEGDVRPYNSAAFVRVPALAASGGYDRRFWLDYLDHATFFSLTRSGYRIWIAGDVQVEHHLSLHDDRSSVGEAHFEDFVKAESAFRDLHQSWLEGILFTGRLVVRALNQKRRGDPPFFVRSTLSVLRDRVSLSRSRRIAKWEREMAVMQMGPSIKMIQSGCAVQNDDPVPSFSEPDLRRTPEALR